MQFNAVETRLVTPNGSSHKVGNQLLNLCMRQCPRASFGIIRRANRCLANQFLWRTITGMMQLNIGHLSLGPNGVGNASEASDVLITKTTQLSREPLTHLLHMGSTRHD
jgi:hypothetical protein